MPDSIRYFLWIILSLGLLILGVMAFWVFLIILGIIIIGKIIYLKLFNKGSITYYTFSTRREDRPNPNPFDPDSTAKNENEQKYTTVIDADNPDKEYKIPKF